MSRWASAVAAGIVTVSAASCAMTHGACTSPRDLVVANPKEAVRDAHGLLAERKGRGTGDTELLQPERLPASLRLPGLRYAIVHADHLDLVLARNPDWQIGGRIWAPEHRAHADTATAYEGIHFFQYTNDLPQSPTNIP